METYHGHVKSPQDAIILFEACRLGILPRVQRRLSEKERQQIRSGSVFVWDEREAGMRRWTDGKSWSASRVSGSFLTYREMEGKRGGTGFATTNGRKSGSKSADGKDSDQDGGEDGPDGYRYKPDGLMKQSFSITTSDNRHLHLISYYARPPVNCQPLKQPASDALLRNVHPQKGMYPEATVNEPSAIPAVTRSPMGGSPYPPAAAPPPGAHQPYQYPPPQGYPQAYPQPSSWPASPAHTPPAYYSHYPPQSAYQYPPQHGSPPYGHPSHPIPPQYGPPPGPAQLDRPPPPPTQTALPMPHSTAAEHQSSPYYHTPSARPNHLPPYSQPGPSSSLRPNPYGSTSLNPPRYSQAPAPAPQIPYSAPVPINGYHKPPSPPLSSNGVTPNEKVPELAQIAAPAVNGDSKSPPARLPTITAMLNAESQDPHMDGRGDRNGSRPGSRSPAGTGPRLPETMAASGFRKAQNDLDKLKMQFLK